MSQTLQAILQNNEKVEKRKPPVINTIANRGEGISELYQEIISKLNLMREDGTLIEKRKQRFHDRVIDIVQDKIHRDFWTPERLKELDKEALSYSVSKTSARAVAEKIIKVVEGE